MAVDGNKAPSGPSDRDIPAIGEGSESFTVGQGRASWSGSLTDLGRQRSFVSDKGDDGNHRNSFTGSSGNRNKGGNKWHNIKRSPLDVSQVKTEVEGLRNSEHRLSKVGIAT